MAHIFDFHFHSLYSDGDVMPAEYVALAKQDNPGLTHLALTDHDTYNGCRGFLDACRAHDIEGFVSCEIGGTHPDFPQFEMHIHATFGNEWNDAVAARADLFHPYWNKLRQADVANLFLFLEKAAELGHPLSFRDVVRKTVEEVLARPELADPGLIQPVKFGHLRKLLFEKGLEARGRKDEESFEKSVWRRTHTRPAYTPPFTLAYEAFRKARPAVCLAHPMLYPWTLDEARRVIAELKISIGLVAIEAHYANKPYPEWIGLARDLNLLVSAGSDCHSAVGLQKGPTERHGLGVPVVDEADCDFERLIDTYRAAGTV